MVHVSTSSRRQSGTDVRFEPPAGLWSPAGGCASEAQSPLRIRLAASSAGIASTTAGAQHLRISRCADTANSTLGINASAPTAPATHVVTTESRVPWSRANSDAYNAIERAIATPVQPTSELRRRRRLASSRASKPAARGSGGGTWRRSPWSCFRGGPASASQNPVRTRRVVGMNSGAPTCKTSSMASVRYGIVEA